MFSDPCQFNAIYGADIEEICAICCHSLKFELIELFQQIPTQFTF